MKFKVGDSVKIREDLEEKKYQFGCWTTKEMVKMSGKIATVTAISKHGDETRYKLDVDNGGWFWTSDMLEPVEEHATIKDSGDRTEYSTGAVRDLKEGKGRCDLMPMDIMYDFFNDLIFADISRFKTSGSYFHLLSAISHFRSWKSCHGSIYGTFLDVSKHFEDGAKKYGENNWQKGIPVHSYIDSAIRHYLKYKDGWDDEPHDRAFVWNLLCCAWTIKHHPELDDWTEKREKNND